MKIAQLFILILAFFVMAPAKAGLLIEPVLGYTFLKSEGGSDEDKSKGPSIGGRLGYQNLGFQLGLDYLRSNLDVDDKGFDQDMVMSEFAGFVGFEFPIFLRVYAGYIFSANADSKYQGQKLSLTEGTGTKFGVGFTGLPFVDINFEYRKGTFTETKMGGTKFDLDTDYSAFMVGISLPFVL
jgi:hypothetical protein